MLWGKSMERKDDMNKIGAGKPVLELQADKEADQVPDDAAAKV